MEKLQIPQRRHHSSLRKRTIYDFFSDTSLIVQTEKECIGKGQAAEGDIPETKPPNLSCFIQKPTKDLGPPKHRHQPGWWERPV